jgi:hypothetical protein
MISPKMLRRGYSVEFVLDGLIRPSFDPLPPTASVGFVKRYLYRSIIDRAMISKSSGRSGSFLHRLARFQAKPNNKGIDYRSKNSHGQDSQTGNSLLGRSNREPKY